MLVVTRHRGSTSELASEVLAALSERPGFVRGWVGRAADDPELLMLTTEWADVGSWRRALSPIEVKMLALPFFGHAVDEDSAFIVLDARGVEAAPVIDPHGAG